ncbi:MAG TPA: hypothetical protein PLH58_08170, partial [Paludibacteraceae bacterium]|nr:hypothetical protein [Paludibacteraceae bacterium]
ADGFFQICSHPQHPCHSLMFPISQHIPAPASCKLNTMPDIPKKLQDSYRCSFSKIKNQLNRFIVAVCIFGSF